ncbi:hypothetical protein NFI96_024077, partial [Prochilodus magdalenae]
TKLLKSHNDIQQMIQERLKKTNEIKQCIQMSKENTDREIAHSIEVFTTLVHCIERCQAELLKVMEEKQRAAERHAEELIRELEIEVAKLKVKGSELEQLIHSKDYLRLLQKNHPSNSTKPKKMDLTLDPSTANPWLVVSEDGKHVKDGNVEQEVPDDSRRFDTAPCVLAREPISGGCSYWEVEVANKTAWDLGVARQSVNRKGLVTLSPEDGYWAICLRSGREYRACDGESVLLSLNIQPLRIAIFVNYEDGQVSFYDPVSQVHIFSFSGQRFTESLLAFFNPDMNDSGSNRAPLSIRPVRHQDKSYDGATI